MQRFGWNQPRTETMSEKAQSPSNGSQVCPRCGTRVSASATRCTVCGKSLGPGASARQSSGRAVTLPLPLAIALLVVFALLSAGATFAAVRFSGVGAAEPAPTETVTPTVSPTSTLTPEPTATNTPLPTATPISHTVGVNETCLQIAAFYGVSVQSIIQINQLATTCPLSVGQTLLIPHPTATPSPEPTATLPPAEATRAACQTVDYEVQANDSLFAIAQNYAVEMQSIKDWNGMTGDTVFEGQLLIIPLCQRTIQTGPTATPTVPAPYPAPNLLLPQDGAAFDLSTDTVSLQWAAVGELREDEYYHVTIVDVTEGSGNRRIDDYVTDTKYIVPSSLRPGEATSHILRWWVESVRQIGSNSRGDPIYESAGSKSAERDFSWSGAPTAGETSTPGG
jgi:LysM repeat protein/ribosomal protein L40E